MLYKVPSPMKGMRQVWKLYNHAEGLPSEVSKILCSIRTICPDLTYSGVDLDLFTSNRIDFVKGSVGILTSTLV